MKTLNLAIVFQLSCALLHAQADSLTSTRFVIGLSAPELLHVGVNVDLSRFSQLGLSAGLGPSWGQAWPTVNAEHRLYLGKTKDNTKRKQWFFRQGGTYFPAGEEGALSLTVGADLGSKSRSHGWTIDAGTFILFQNDRDNKNKVYPALRFQYYSYFKKSKGGKTP